MEPKDQPARAVPETPAQSPKPLNPENVTRENAERDAAEKEAAQRIADQAAAQVAVDDAQAAVTKAVTAVADGAAPGSAVSRAAEAVEAAKDASEKAGAAAETKERASQLNFAFHHFSKDARSYYFSDRADAESAWIVGPKIKEDERLYAALRRFDDLLRANFPQQAPGTAASADEAKRAELIGGVGPSSAPQKFDAATVRLRSGVTWADLQRIRRSRSIYASPGSSGVYATSIARAEPALGAGTLAEALQMTEKGLAVDFGWGERKVFDSENEVALCARDLADALAERGFNITGGGDHSGCKLHSISERGIVAPSGKVVVSNAALASRAGGATLGDGGEYEGAVHDEHGDEAGSSDAEMGDSAHDGDSGDRVPSEEGRQPAQVVTPARAPKPPLPPAQHAAIRECLEAVAGADDGATKHDNVGFSADHANRNNTGFAQLLLARNPWNDKEARAGRILVLKYHRQVPAKLKNAALHGLDSKLLKEEHFTAEFLHRYCGWEAPTAEAAKATHETPAAPPSTEAPVHAQAAPPDSSSAVAPAAGTESKSDAANSSTASDAGSAEATATAADVTPESAPEAQPSPETKLDFFAKTPKGRVVMSAAGAERVEKELKERAPEICAEIARKVGQEFDPNRLFSVMVKTIDGGSSVRVTYSLNVRGAPNHLKSLVVSVSVSQKTGMFVACAETYATLRGNEAAASKASVLVDVCNRVTGPVPREMLAVDAADQTPAVDDSEVNRESFELSGEQKRAIQAALTIIDRNSSNDPKTGGFAPEHGDIGHALAMKHELANEEALVARALVEHYSSQVQERDLAMFRTAVAGFPGKYTKQADLDPNVMRAHMGWASPADAEAPDSELPHPADLEASPPPTDSSDGAPADEAPPVDNSAISEARSRHPLETVAGPHSLDLRNSPMVVVGVIPLQISPAQHRALSELADGREMRLHSYRMDEDTLVICDIEFRGERPEHVNLEAIVEGAARSAGVPVNPEIKEGAEAVLGQLVEMLVVGAPAEPANEVRAPAAAPGEAPAVAAAPEAEEEGVMGDTSIKTLADGTKVRTVRHELLHPAGRAQRAPAKTPSGPSI